MAIKAAAEANHGHALPAYLDWLVPRIGKLETEQLPAMLKMFERAATKRLGPLDGPAQRVIARLALVAIAGELASRAGVVPWRTETAWNALLENAGLWHNAAGEKRANGLDGMMDRLTALVRTPDRFTSLPEGTEAEGEFAGWIDADHIYLDCEVFAEIAGNRSLQEAARDLLHRLPGRYVPDRPRTYRLRRDRFED
ncbi:hypothetical protein SAMN04488020_1155 [Palleronia marisminoris]|uniref:Uncharacterized protein n=2 Tax=Palleronia marisminoris TaxID=315423 RepID=A0A1Y5TNH3_9RHOB|nr:hypothetical protein SAMN04488020_1155 [Palleronia marisminoris]SLN67784.1 hypothetical protein PAM7066_03399 [Palleronia marisminoris]